MSRITVLLLFPLYFLIISISTAQNKTTISGTVVEAESGDPLVGVNVHVQDRLIGTTTNQNGAFSLSTSISPPFTLIFSCVGYASETALVKTAREKLSISMKQQDILGQEIVISASRIEEKYLSSPVTVEKMDMLDIQQISAANFYDGLYKLKGVDMNVASLTFRYPNARGFVTESNYRMLQLVDGIENTSPGLTFAAGNLFGLSQLDLESVEMAVGASSALYGPGGMNGALLMTSKSPFDYQGLSFIAQTGLMHVNAGYRDAPAPMYDLSVRYAKAFNDRWAFKINANYLSAIDWHASDFRDRTNLSDLTRTRESNPGYDGVNTYGDDIIVPINLEDLGPSIVDGAAQELGYVPGSPEYDAFYNQLITYFPDQLISRTGWEEKFLADYNTRNIKVNGALHYRINDNLEAIAQVNYNNGVSVYTTQNRASFKNFDLMFGKLELKNPNYVVRAWMVAEDAGESYDIGGTGLAMNESWKPSTTWYQEYLETYTQSAIIGTEMDEAHAFARLIADNRDAAGTIFNPSKPALPLPGSSEFDQIFNELTSKTINNGGTKIIDKSKMWHVEGMYNFSKQIDFVDLLVGISHRIYSLNTGGTLFYDQPGNPIIINQFGAFGQISKDLLNDKLKISFSGRYDKNEYFKGKFTPRISGVFNIGNKGKHFLRASYQTAYRFPSASDQWIDFDIGFYRGVGGQPIVQQKYNFDTNPVYPLSGSNPVTDEPVVENGPFEIPEFGPEKVTAMELGYKGLQFNDKLLIDAYIYHNQYDGFLANQLLAQYPFTPEQQKYSTMISVEEQVNAWGWALGADLLLARGYTLGANVAYNKLVEGADREGRQSRYNTPDYRYNVYFENRNVYKNIGFNLNFRWQNEFLWQSNFGEAQIPAFSTLDAHISYKWSKLKSIIKLGGSNLLNDYYQTSFGSAQVGGLYYISWSFDELMN